MVICLAEQIIPADKDPGATEANVINYIDKQLVGPLERFQENYRTGLDAIQKTSSVLYQKKFEELEWEKQTDFLEKMERNELPSDHWPDSEQRSFFRLIMDHSMQGFYGSPRHGGNCNYVSYKMMKIDYPHIIGQNRYRAEDLIKRQTRR